MAKAKMGVKTAPWRRVAVVGFACAVRYLCCCGCASPRIAAPAAGALRAQ